MSNQQSTEGRWETQSASSRAVKIGNNPACISGHEASAEGTFDVSQKIYSNILYYRLILAWPTGSH
jgi:hypothetical protein